MDKQERVALISGAFVVLGAIIAGVFNQMNNATAIAIHATQTAEARLVRTAEVGPRAPGSLPPATVAAPAVVPSATRVASTPSPSTPMTSGPGPAPTLLPPTPSLPATPTAVRLTGALPISWQGRCEDADDGDRYDVVFTVDKLAGRSFTGTLHWPTIFNSITAVAGELVTSFGDAVQQSKWRYVQGFPADTSGAWLTFTETDLLQGRDVELDLIYLAHLRDDGALHAVWFWDEADPDPDGQCTLSLVGR